MKVLQAFIADDNGGLTKYILQNYTYIQKYGVQFDFLTYEKNELSYENKLIQRGGKVFHIRSVINFINYIQDLRHILKENCYDIVHFNMSYANFVPIILIKLILPKQTKIILHSHSMGFDEQNRMIKYLKKSIHKIGRQIIPFTCDGYLGCTHDAGKWMFTESTRKELFYKVVHNAINISSFIYNENIRVLTRKKLHLSNDDFVIGHIGRFTYQKNHEFLIKVFHECLQKKSDCKLMLIGDGPNKKNIEIMSRNLGIEDRVLFLGNRNDIPKLLQAMDVFCLPSRFEGLGMVGVEAQAAGLTCFASDVVPKELAVTNKCKFLPLADKKEWVERILETQGDIRYNTLEQIKEAGYEINNEIKHIVEYYKRLISLER